MKSTEKIKPSKKQKLPGIVKNKTSIVKAGETKKKLKIKEPKLIPDEANVKKLDKKKLKSEKILKTSKKSSAVSKNTEDINVQKPKKVGKKHQKDLEGLKDIDPEFYNFLKQNDKQLLDFNLFDSEDSDEEKKESAAKSGSHSKKATEDDDSEEDENDDDESDEKFHKPSGKLEVGSDESDFDEGEEADDIATDGAQKITLNLLRQWQLQLEKSNVSIDIVRKVIQAFSSALASISGDEGANGTTAYKVVGAATFNAVVQLCILHLQPAILRILGLTPKSTTPLHKTKKWTKVRGCLRYYFMDLMRLIENVSSPNILSVLLKHLHQMSGMVASFSSIGKTILKRLIVLWATGDETVRVLAFLCILKITRNQQVSMLNHVLKAMYLSYVRNSKFVSPNTLPGINFMRRSLVEMFALDLNVTYQHAFLYIRQLAIHLRNAVILKKKDSFQSVYNWQYINSLRLWADLLGTTTNKPQLQPLVYPLVTIITGVIKLIPTAQYFPLRFHCIQTLITLVKETRAFIPVLPFILEVLKSNTFKKKHTSVSMKPMQFTCILRLNKTQMSENGFRDEVIENVCGLTLEYLTLESASLAFCDLVVPVVIALKQYLKECKNSNHTRKLKQLLDKIKENSRFIENERRKVTFGLKDLEQVQAWQTQVHNKGTPLSIYFTSWLKTHETKKRRQAANTENINDYDLPTIKRKHGAAGVAVKNEKGEVELFPSDSEDDELLELPVNDDNTETEEAKIAKPIKKKNKEKTKTKDHSKTDTVEFDIPLEEMDGDVDIVKDLDLDDW